ncbi:MAG TPA: hypothetical protein PK743_02360 [Luteimonas sp.]|nr:hypothetical protein [Luteimonas sp.]HRP71462.1 hypothetical protein [Luteimonas sp.]
MAPVPARTWKFSDICIATLLLAVALFGLFYIGIAEFRWRDYTAPPLMGFGPHRWDLAGVIEAVVRSIAGLVALLSLFLFRRHPRLSLTLGIASALAAAATNAYRIYDDVTAWAPFGAGALDVTHPFVMIDTLICVVLLAWLGVRAASECARSGSG